MNFQIVKINGINKAVGSESGLVMTPEFFDIVIKPDRFAQIPEIADLIQCMEDLMGTRIRRFVTDDRILEHAIFFPDFSPHSEHGIPLFC